MKWIVGLDVGPEAHAAVEFLRGVQAAGPDAGESVVAAHVLVEEHMRVALRLRHLDEVVAEAREAGEAALQAQQFEAPLEVVQAVDAASGMAEMALRHSADAVVVARHAGRTVTGSSGSAGSPASCCTCSPRRWSSSPMTCAPPTWAPARWWFSPAWASTRSTPSGSPGASPRASVAGWSWPTRSRSP